VGGVKEGAAQGTDRARRHEARVRGLCPGMDGKPMIGFLVFRVILNGMSNTSFAYSQKKKYILCSLI
jgi:hypothetical protein